MFCIDSSEQSCVNASTGVAVVGPLRSGHYKDAIDCVTECSTDDDDDDDDERNRNTTQKNKKKKENKK